MAAQLVPNPTKTKAKPCVGHISISRYAKKKLVRGGDTDFDKHKDKDKDKEKEKEKVKTREKKNTNLLGLGRRAPVGL